MTPVYFRKEMMAIYVGVLVQAVSIDRLAHCLLKMLER